MIKRILLFIVVFATFAVSYAVMVEDDFVFANVKSRSKLDNPEGIYAIWIGKDGYLLNRPYLKCDQIVLQWADIEKGPGVYYWSMMDN